MSLAIGIDVGGSKVAAGVVDAGGRVLHRCRVATPGTGVDALLGSIVEVASRLSGCGDVVAVGVGAAAYVDRERSRVLFAPNLPWRDLPLRDVLQRRLGLPVVVENDGNAAAWGEHRHGAGVGVEDLLLVTVGTGVGGGLVLGGRLHRGGFGVAGEVGHLCLVPDGLECGCGARGCLEMYGSGTALVAEARRAAATGVPGAAALLSAAGSVEAIDGSLVSRVAEDGDPFARGLLADLGQRLGAGIASLTAVLDPALVVLGGGVSAAGALLLGPVREAFEARHPGRGLHPAPQFRTARLGSDAGVVGAAELARESA